MSIIGREERSSKYIIPGRYSDHGTPGKWYKYSGFMYYFFDNGLVMGLSKYTKKFFYRYYEKQLTRGEFKAELELRKTPLYKAIYEQV